jgi:hypothetical protein
MGWLDELLYEEGIRKAERDVKAIEAAKNALAEGISPEIAAKIAGLPLAEVQKLVTH